MEWTVSWLRCVLPQILPGAGAHENEQVKEESFEEPGSTAYLGAGEFRRAAAACWYKGNPLWVAGLISDDHVGL
jgi:hypothetical protein